MHRRMPTLLTRGSPAKGAGPTAGPAAVRWQNDEDFCSWVQDRWLVPGRAASFVSAGRGPVERTAKEGNVSAPVIEIVRKINGNPGNQTFDLHIRVDGMPVTAEVRTRGANWRANFRYENPDGDEGLMSMRAIGVGVGEDLLDVIIGGVAPMLARQLGDGLVEIIGKSSRPSEVQYRLRPAGVEVLARVHFGRNRCTVSIQNDKRIERIKVTVDGLECEDIDIRDLLTAMCKVLDRRIKAGDWR